jgi:hypothetical protein
MVPNHGDYRFLTRSRRANSLNLLTNVPAAHKISHPVRSVDQRRSKALATFDNADENHLLLITLLQPLGMKAHTRSGEYDLRKEATADG